MIERIKDNSFPFERDFKELTNEKPKKVTRNNREFVYVTSSDSYPSKRPKNNNFNPDKKP